MKRLRNSRRAAWVVGGLLLLALPACGTAPAAMLPSSSTAVAEGVVQPTIRVLPRRATATPTPNAAPTAPPADLPSAPPAAAPALLPPLDPLPPRDLGFDGARAFAHLEAQMQWVPRDTGSPGSQQAGDYIIEQVRAAGWTVEEQRFEYQGTPVRNIIAKRGSGPVLIVGAHYDARRRSDKDPDPAKRNLPMPGANDGASGTAILLELARHIDTDQLGREVWLTFFDAEDNGGLDGWEYAVGSAYMAQNLTEPLPEAMVLLDLVGDADLQIYYELNSTPALSESIWGVAAELGYSQFIPEPKYSIFDDHTAFLNRGIPAVDIIDFDYPYWDTSNDTIDKVSAASLEAVGRTVERWLDTRARP